MGNTASLSDEENILGAADKALGGGQNGSSGGRISSNHPDDGKNEGQGKNDSSTDQDGQARNNKRSDGGGNVDDSEDYMQ